MDDQRILDRRLHIRLVDKEDTALSEIVELYGEKLFKVFSKQFTVLNEQLINGAIFELFLSLYDRPEQYNPNKLSLEKYLRMALKGDLLNLLEKEKRKPTFSAESVELFNELPETRVDDPLQQQIDQKKLDLIYARLRELFPKEPHFSVAMLVIEKERSREMYAQVLELTDQPKKEMEKKVDRFKDKVKKKLKRNDWVGFLNENK